MTDIDISPEAVERMACILDGRGGFVKGNVVVATLRALSAALTQSRAERAAAQSELDDCLASDWPIWATQIYNTLKEFGYRYDHFDGIDLPEDVSEFLRGFPDGTTRRRIAGTRHAAGIRSRRTGAHYRT